MLKNIFVKIKNVFKALGVYLFTFTIYPFARICLHKKNIWLISEREHEARDNGVVFFEYLNKYQPTVNCFYVIKTDSPDYKKVSSIGQTIEFGSIKHFWYFCGAKYLISTTIQAFCPNYFLTILRRKINLPGKYIYLKHGIIKDNLTQLYKKKTKFNLFICGGKPEYEYILNNFGYAEEEIAYTGLARFDRYHETFGDNKKTILIMPTWRRNAFIEKEAFIETDYYKTWSSLLNNPEFITFLAKNNITVYFYLHPLFQPYTNLFKSTNNQIVICGADSCDLQDLIKKTSCLITDFSSLSFDFGYMRKPVFYYQYDEASFYKEHYNKGYFKYKEDGFGPVVNNEQDLLKKIYYVAGRNFKSEDVFIARSSYFFVLHDNKNSKRIYECIKERLK